MPVIRQSLPRTATFALKPSLLHGLWNTIRMGAASAKLAIRFANGATAETRDFDELPELQSRHRSAIRELRLSATMPDRSERRAVFEAGSAFIENDRAFAGPADVVEKAGALVRQGLTPSTWHYPDPLLLLTLFCVVYLVVSVVVAHASGRPDLPLPLSIIGAGAAPVFLALRLIFPPNIRIPLDDASFEKSAARHRAGLILAPLLGAILPLAPIVTSPN